MSPGPRLSIIIVNFDTQEWLRRCLTSLDRQSIPRTDLEVIVVDNASADDSVQMVRSEFPNCHLVCQEENAGFGAANNAGARESSAPTLLFLNPDTEVAAENSIEQFLDMFEGQTDAVIAGGTIYDENGDLERSSGSFPTLTSLVLDRLLATCAILRTQLGLCSGRHWTGFDRQRNVDWVTAAAIWVRAEAFRAVGGFDEAIFMYYEDVDLCYRATKAGLGRCIYHPSGAITHFRNKAPTSMDRKQLQRKWLRHFGRKHYNGPLHGLTRLTFACAYWVSRSR